MGRLSEKKVGWGRKVLVIWLSLVAMSTAVKGLNWLAAQADVNELEPLCRNSDDIAPLLEIAAAEGHAVFVYAEAQVVTVRRHARRSSGESYTCSLRLRDTSPFWQVVSRPNSHQNPPQYMPIGVGVGEVLNALSRSE